MSVFHLNSDDAQAQYEVLRQQILETPGVGPSGHGLMLLLSKGMTAWLAGLPALVISPRLPSTGVGSSSPDAPCSSSLQSAIAEVLADMVLAHTQREAHR